MSFLKKIQQKEFWKNVLKIALPFFIFVTLISLFMNSWRAIFAGDFANVAHTNFTNGKWVQFWSYKIIFSVCYGVYMANKNMK